MGIIQRDGYRMVNVAGKGGKPVTKQIKVPFGEGRAMLRRQLKSQGRRPTRGSNTGETKPYAGGLSPIQKLRNIAFAGKAGAKLQTAVINSLKSRYGAEVCKKLRY